MTARTRLPVHAATFSGKARLLVVASVTAAALLLSTGVAAAGPQIGAYLHPGTTTQGCDGPADGDPYMVDEGYGSVLLQSKAGKLSANISLKNAAKSATYTATVWQCEDTGPQASGSTTLTTSGRGAGSAKLTVTRIAGSRVYVTLANTSNANDTFWSDSRTPTD